MINLNKNKISGFTLVETLVALFIFSISVLAVMSVLSVGLTNTTYAKNKITAEYLAQEGIEYFRNMRDTFALSTDPTKDGWPLFLEKLETGGCMDSKGCYFDNDESFGAWQTTRDISLIPCEDKCKNIKYESSTGVYGIYKGNGTIFSRKIQMKKTENGEGVIIFSEVVWDSGSKLGTISFSQDLSNWIE